MNFYPAANVIEIIYCKDYFCSLGKNKDLQPLNTRTSSKLYKVFNDV